MNANAPRDNRQPHHPQLVKQAVAHFDSSQTKLAAAMQNFIEDSQLDVGPVLQGHIWNWLKGRRIVSPHMAVIMEMAAGKDVVSRQQFYPELYKHVKGDAA